MYYNFDKLFSYNFLIAFVIGERGVGKTYNSKVAALKRFLKTGEQFMYIRRYKTELDTALATFWDDLIFNECFKDHELKVTRSKMLTKFTCDGKVCGYALPLSTSNIVKSTPFPKVSLIIFDEFLLDSGAGVHRYLKSEVTLFLDLFETVGRLRSNIRAILLGNALGVHSSPYFCYWDLELPEGDNEFRTFKNGTIVVNYIRNLEYRKAKKQSRFGALIDGTMYGDYVINNQVLRENNSFIATRPAKSTFWAIINVNSMPIGLWHGVDGLFYLSEKYDPNTKQTFVFDYNDHTEKTIFESTRENMYLHAIIRAYKRGWLRFENQKIKSHTIPLLNKCIAI